MNLGEFRKLTELIPDDTIVVVPGFDHNYRRVKLIDVSAIEAVELSDGSLCQYFNTPNEMKYYEPEAKLSPVLVIH